MNVCVFQKDIEDLELGKVLLAAKKHARGEQTIYRDHHCIAISRISANTSCVVLISNKDDKNWLMRCKANKTYKNLFSDDMITTESDHHHFWCKHHSVSIWIEVA